MVKAWQACGIAVLVVGVSAWAEGPATQPWRNGVGMVTHGEAAPVGGVEAGKAVETRAAIGVGQAPAFVGQTRVPAVVTKTAVEVRVVATGLRKPWGLAFLPGWDEKGAGKILVTEKVGAMRIVGSDGVVGKQIGGVPRVVYFQDGGLMDVVVDPDFSKNRMVYWAYVEPRERSNGTAVAKGRLREDEMGLENVTVIYRAEPSTAVPMHYGSRLLFDKEGNLFVTLGERFFPPTRPMAQEVGSAMGKILRITTEGKAAAGNPFAGKGGALPEVWTYGHRNPQGLMWNPASGELWETEHGPQGGDEINVIEAGKNYGWPVVAYGLEYDGKPVGSGKQQMEGMEQPVYYWDPAIAPSGATFYDGKLIPEWKGNLFVCGLVGQHVARLVVEGRKVVGEERLLQEEHQRMRDIQEGPDGALWVVTDEMEGRLIRIGAKR